jgi:hypothetical protein
MQWPMPVPRDGRSWELWYNGNNLILISTNSFLPGEVELTQEVWDELPSKAQEGLFKLSLLDDGCTLEGFGTAGKWIRLDYGDPDTTLDRELYYRIKRNHATRGADDE